MGRIAASACVVAASAAAAAAGEAAVTFEQVLQRARERAPSVLAARLRVDEARGRLAGASRLVSDNPRLEAARGSRRGADGADWEIGLTQDLDLFGRRGARVSAARAGLEREVAAAGEAARRLLREVAAAFFRAAHFQERVRMARTAEDVAASLRRAAERRYEAGDIAAIELNLARSGHGRAGADAEAAEAGLRLALGDLRALLGIPADEPLVLAGGLRLPDPPEPDALLDLALRRPDLQAIEAELREAEAESRLARRSSWPAAGLGVRYEQEAGDRILWTGVLLSLPLFDRGQEARAVAAARVSRLQVERDALRRGIEVELRAAADAVRLRRAALARFERDVLPSLDDNDALSVRSYEAGEMGLPELLLVRRDALDNRAAHLELALDAVLAEVELLHRAGGLR